MSVDLRSDTVTRPTAAMRKAMAEAEVGDDVFGDDPTVNRLQDMTAELLGKEAALFCPSGTMTNQIAIRLHTQPGDEILMEGGAHPYNFEAGAPAMLSGVLVRPVQGTHGILDPDDVAACFRPEDPHFAPLTMVCAEDTANRGGGTVYPLDVLDRLAEVTHARAAAAHMDGARLFNASVKSGVDIARRVRDYDTVSICLSKGLGAPVGSLLAGPRDLIRRGIRVRKAFGGGMRQAGIIAAAGVHALDHNIERLADDHARAEGLALGLRHLGFSVQDPATNMVYLDVPDAPAMVSSLGEAGVHCCALGPHAIRLVTHLDVDDEAISATLAAFETLSSLGAG
jgi:threonine aldolase